MFGIKTKNTGFSFTAFKKRIYLEVSEKYHHVLSEVLGIEASPHPLLAQPVCPTDPDPLIMADIVSRYESDILPAHKEVVKLIASRNFQVGNDRIKAASYIKLRVSPLLVAYINQKHPLTDPINWPNLQSIILVMAWIKEAFNASISMNPNDVKKYYKDRYHDVSYDHKDTSETFIMKFDEKLEEWNENGGCVTVKEAIDDFMLKLPQEYNEFRSTLMGAETENDVNISMGLSRNPPILTSEDKFDSC